MIYMLATPLLILSGMPQMMKLLKTKRSNDISRWTYLITSTAIALLFMRAMEVGDTPLIMANGASLCMTLTNTILIFKYHDKNC